MSIKIEEQRVLQILQDLVRIPSVNPNLDGGVPERKIADYVEAFFARLGLASERREVRPDRPNVIGILPGVLNDVPGLLLEAHMDTVQITNMTIDPFSAELRDGKLYGRGACDTKASIAAMLVAMEWFVTNDIKPHVPVFMAATVDEEVNFLGVLDVLEAGHRFAAAIVGEPTELQAVVAHKGVVRCEIETIGVSAHSSKPEEGVNAISGMMKVVHHIDRTMNDRLRDVTHPLVGQATLNVTEITGGVAPNTIPERCRIKIDRRTIPGEDSDQVWRDIQAEMALFAATDEQLNLIVHPPFVLDYAMDTSPDSEIVRLVTAKAGEKIGEVRTHGVPYGTDASKLTHVGIPSVVFGPGSIDQAHTKDEWVELKQVVLAAEIIVETMLAFGK
ncbi:M20 family metallopeptidase [Paenibacillus eucommiae]|uniref:Probable succinyl-diaminopimelate desuccinylase n=1 Tax=Paenibacillus eucommiae TaxID=1355755 RepID=A0ABS4IVG5_9BACL|nr:M20 family metallopeptidase [Paenibacillus eucommiae]MBP1991578.1 acetylornithine deacetylase [Paenibacillus eucommiae]